MVLAFMGVLLGEGACSLHSNKPWLGDKIWPLPACQREVENLEPDVLALPHPAFGQASHVPGTVLGT